MSGLRFGYSVSFFIVIIYNVLGSCFEIESLTQPDVIVESPVWSSQENALYWVNGLGQTVFRMDGDTGEITTRHIHHGPTLALALVKDYPGYIVVAVRTGLYLLKWGAPGGDKALKLLTLVDRGKPDNYIDYLKADANGRLWIGTIGKVDPNLETFVELEQATLYSMDANDFKHPAVKKRPVSMSKGMVWAFHDTKMYYNDGPTRRVTAFDFDLENGVISNETVIFNFDDYDIPGMPDGMTLDADENLWVATYNSMILNIDPRTGQLLRAIELPADQITSMTWGGTLMDTLYVTTAGFNVSYPKPMSGMLLKITNLGTVGYPDYEFMFPDAPLY